MKEELCKAFCGGIVVRQVPAGLAVGTDFRGLGGDRVGFYVIRDQSLAYRVVDDGGTAPFLEAAGFDLSTQTRGTAFHELLAQYGVEYDEESREIHTGPMSAEEVPHAALKFMTAMIRIPDLMLLAPERVASTFEEDASRRIRTELSGKAEILEDEPIAPGLKEFRADLVLKARDRTPVAVFLSRSEQKVYEAILCQMAALYEQKLNVSIIALLEKTSTISATMRRRASNRLTAVTEFEGDEDAAIGRIVREVTGMQPAPTLH
jgi:hypothetical protein